MRELKSIQITHTYKWRVGAAAVAVVVVAARLGCHYCIAQTRLEKVDFWTCFASINNNSVCDSVDFIFVSLEFRLFHAFESIFVLSQLIHKIIWRNGMESLADYSELWSRQCAHISRAEHLRRQSADDYFEISVFFIKYVSRQHCLVFVFGRSFMISPNWEFHWWPCEHIRKNTNSNRLNSLPHTDQSVII